MDNDDYTLLSSKEVSELKQDVEYLKKNPLGGSKEGRSLLEGIEKLNENIEQLIEIFKEASDMMKAEEREADVILKRIAPIESKLEELSDQNQKIAKGILAVADMVAEKEEMPRPRPQMSQSMMPRPQPMQQPMQRPQMPPMQRPMMQPNMPSLSGMPAPTSQSMGLPPPPMPPKKKGLFGLSK